MEVKSVLQLEVKKNDRVYIFSMPFGSTFGEAYDAAFETLNKIMEMSKEAADKAKQSVTSSDINN